MRIEEMGLVFGVGINDGKYKTGNNGVLKKEYIYWRGLLGRCYHRTENRKIAYATYDGCSVSDNFKSYSYFYEWCQDQIGMGFSDFDLDKDLLEKGNKIYSEEKCLFIPSEINTAIQYKRKNRGGLPIGVTKQGKSSKFAARVRRHGKMEHLGLYLTPEDAFNSYKKEKERYIQYLAEKYKSRIDERAYLALMAYNVDIDD